MMSCAEMQASGNWVEIEATLQDPKAKAEGFDDGKDPLRTSFALYGRMSATRVSQQEGGGPSASTGGLNLGGLERGDFISYLFLMEELAEVRTGARSEIIPNFEFCCGPFCTLKISFL